MFKQLFYRFCRAAARRYIKRYQPYIVGITGSVGKTSCRMIVTQVMQKLLPEQRIETSHKNFNSELGLGLSILQIESYDPTLRGTLKAIAQITRKLLHTKKPYDILVLEYGIDYIGEMDIEVGIARPHISIFTMIDKVHAMNIGTMEQILAEKSKLLKAAKEVVCIPVELESEIVPYLKDAKSDCMTYSFHESQEGNTRFDRYELDIDAHGLPIAKSHVHVGEHLYTVGSTVLGSENMGYLSLGILLARIMSKRLETPLHLEEGAFYNFTLHLQHSRFDIYAGKYDSILIDSSYNGAPQSMRKMIMNVHELHKRLYPDYELRLCLGEMRELGEYTEDEHRKLMHELGEVDRLYLLGKSMTTFAADELKNMGLAPDRYKTFSASKDLGAHVVTDLMQTSKKVLILFKGSQNTIFLEEAVKVVLEDPTQAATLCRQTPWWLEKKQKQGYRALGVAFGSILMGLMVSGCSLLGNVGHESKPIIPPSKTTMPVEVSGDTGSRACFGTACFRMEIADTPQERQKGLMFRTELDQDAGMIFAFDGPGNYSFWMKNTLIPLDMLRLNAQKQVMFIANDVQPCREDPCPGYGPNETGALYVVELNAGMSIHNAITTGMSVTLDIVR